MPCGAGPNWAGFLACPVLILLWPKAGLLPHTVRADDRFMLLLVLLTVLINALWYGYLMRLWCCLAATGRRLPRR